MMDGTKGGAQRASSLRPRCFREINPETAAHIYLSMQVRCLLSCVVRQDTLLAHQYSETSVMYFLFIAKTTNTVH
jgi:hypothetical protein